jgi:methylated-DNA-protein-cysteine methyltransferase-like protein
VRQIPSGKVATYGQVAAIVGDCTARMVGYAMAACSDDVPWQRVINAQGKVSPRADSWGTEVQRLRLEEEGIVFDADHKVNLAQVRWSGPSLEWLLENGFTPDEPPTPGDDPDSVQPRLF